MPVLDAMPWLPEAVRSVPSDAELIVRASPRSTDGTTEWLSEHAARALLTVAPDRGQTDALESGFAQATGDILAWLNGDDAYVPGALDVVSVVFARHPDAVAVSGGCDWIGPNGEPLGSIPRVPDASLRGLLTCPWNLPQPATFFRRAAFRKVGGLDPSLDMAMDVDLWLRLARLGRIVLIPETLARFRLHPGAKSQAGAARARREDFMVRRRHGLRPTHPTWWRFAVSTTLRR